MADGVADEKTFFNTGDNTRMCLLYEYLRGLTPRQALNELKKAGKWKVQPPDISEIIDWFARFRATDYSVDAEARKRPIAQEHQDTYNAALKEYKDADKKFGAKPLDTDLMDFLKKLDSLVTQKGFNVSELEINVKNGAQPRHVLIGIEYYLEGSGTTKEHHVVEIYHCGTGVVVRRGQKTKLCEGDGYSYYTMSVAVCQQVIAKLKSVVVKALTLRIDLPDPARPDSPEDSSNFFGKLMGGDSEVDSSASLMELARPLRGLEQLNLKYEHKLPGIDRVKKMKENFDKIFGGRRSMECTITIQVNEEQLGAIAAVSSFTDEKSHVVAKSDQIKISKEEKREDVQKDEPEPAKQDAAMDYQ